MSNESRELQNQPTIPKGSRTQPFAQSPRGSLQIEFLGGNPKVFHSSEITGNGSEQATAHGLGRTPDLVFAVPTNLTGGAYVVVYGTHDSTSARVTVTNGEKYRIVAMAFLPF